MATHEHDNGGYDHDHSESDPRFDKEGAYLGDVADGHTDHHEAWDDSGDSHHEEFIDIDPKDSHEDESYHGEVLQSPGREQLIAQAGATFGPSVEQPHVEHPWDMPTPVPPMEVEEDEFGAHAVTKDGDMVTTEDKLDPPTPEADGDASDPADALYHEDPADLYEDDYEEDPQHSWDDTEK